VATTRLQVWPRSFSMSMILSQNLELMTGEMPGCYGHSSGISKQFWTSWRDS
jgi:hypothetical protein